MNVSGAMSRGEESIIFVIRRNRELTGHGVASVRAEHFSYDKAMASSGHRTCFRPAARIRAAGWLVVAIRHDE